MRKKFSWLILVLLFGVFSCDSNRVYDAYQSVPKQWNKDSVIEFSVEAPDTTNNYNLFINLRNNNDYKFSNIFLIAELSYPNGKVKTDTLEYVMANPDGTFLGTGFSDVKESKLWYKGHEEPFMFTETGDYSVKLQHAMRENGKEKGIVNLQGILDIGFRIEKTQ